MARTKQTARSRGTTNDQPEYDDEDRMEMDGRLTEEEKARRSELEAAPMQAELKHLERRWTKKGKGYLTEPKEDDDIPDDKTNWFEKFALTIVRQYDMQNKYVQRTSLQINSKLLKDLLADIIGYYPGQSFATSDVSIDFPAQCLYHYRPELLAALDEQEEGSECAEHLRILLDFIDEHFVDEIKEGTNLRDKGLISYEHLWTIFKPGSLVYGVRQGQPRVYKLDSYYIECGQCPGLRLSVHHTDYDGDNFGTRSASLKIPQFTGAAPIAALPALPLSMHPDPESIKRALTARGRRWEALAGQNFRQYKGVAIDTEGSRFNIDGRVMVDTHTHHRLEADHAFSVNAYAKIKPSDASASPSADGKRKQSEASSEWDLITDEEELAAAMVLAPLTDEQCLMASPIVRGFSFTEKKFLDFFVDKLRPIEWNTRCFEQLVLPDQQKELVQALVAEHTQRAASGFDDIVKGKGRGLILVLHGPPGVGKTLTAECVAEFARSPLYSISAGDLGGSPSTLDERLSRTLDLASTWNAVLLIDEADVFLERRSLHDMQRNGLVSIFLRVLEYYSGILFMTTNRVRTFDDAFKSRIHVPLKYDELPASSRLRVWKNFLDKIEEGVDIDEAGYAKLAEGRLNGRQIKNVVRTAKSLASYKRRKLDQKQLEQVMDIQMAFEKDLDAAGKEDQDIDMVER
ncbi:AAA family ATPase [Echria macrotheca]|uniref:AAA family ATPase n=1 Tax=Echria macrotheca TaxID=438768 RepID=A0AAJ0F4N0_9PEZI|nr:AAA family ATPase [Echria macrotheca]